VGKDGESGVGFEELVGVNGESGWVQMERVEKYKD
jgi:hypothetical protein